MPSLSAPGREKDQRGGEKVAAEEYPKKHEVFKHTAAVRLTVLR